jgi:cell division protein FtsB
MPIAKTLVALGNWIEKHFPEKITTSEVYSVVRAVEARHLEVETLMGGHADRLQSLAEANEVLKGRVAELEKKTEAYTSEANKMKIMLLTQRQTAGR